MNKPDVFIGECNNHVAHVYARLARPCREGELSLTGRVRGPTNVYGYTLATSYPFANLGAGDTTLLRAIVPDPCTWSPMTPTLYEYWIEDRLGQLPPVHRQEFGIRQLGPRGKSFILDGKRWVPRAAHDDRLTESWEMWRFRAAVRVTQAFDETLFAEASRAGVMIIHETTHKDPVGVRSLLAQLSDYAAVSMVLFQQDAALPAEIAHVAPNILLVKRINHLADMQDWVQAAWIDATDIDGFARLVASINTPIIAVRRYRGTSLAEARAAVDTLQADLAPIGQFAGYVV